MNPQLPDELISAYFDGEVTPEERAAVERLLSESEESQRELNETARLSALLHSFPRESAPAELADNVMKKTSQLPLPVAAEAPAAKPKSKRHVWLQLRAALISAATTAAMFLLVLKLVDDSGPQSATMGDRLATRRAMPAVEPGRLAFDDARSVSMTDDVTPDLANGPAESERLREMTDSPRQMAAPMRSVASDDREPLATQPLSGQPRFSEKRTAEPGSVEQRPGEPVAAKSAATAPSADVGPVPAPAPGPPVPEAAARRAMTPKMAAPGAAAPSAGGMKAVRGAGAAASFGIASQTQPTAEPFAVSQKDSPEIENYANPLSNTAYLDQLQQGKMYTFVPQVADPDTNAGVVDLVVVDVERATETIQVLLGKQKIQRRDKTDRKKSGADDELVVVYAVAPADRIANALNDVKQHPDLFVGWSTQLPLELGNADESVYRKEMNSVDKKQAEPELAEARQAVEALVRRNSITAGVEGSVEGQANGNAALDTLQTPTPLTRSEPTLSKAGSDEGKRGPISESKGDYEVLRVPMGQSLAQGNQYGRFRANYNLQLAGLDRARAQQQQVPLPGVDAGKPQQRVDVSNRSVRMLFVLHPTSIAGTPPAAGAVPASKSSK